MADRATILHTTLTAIANAIRSKTGKTGALLPSAMPDEILGITTGVDTSADTVVASALLSGYTAHNAAGDPITGTIPSKAAATYTPGTSDQTIAAGQYLSGTQTVKGDANLLAKNIKEGITIFGKAGSLTEYKVDILAAENITFSGDYMKISVNSAVKTLIGFVLMFRTESSSTNAYSCISYNNSLDGPEALVAWSTSSDYAMHITGLMGLAVSETNIQFKSSGLVENHTPSDLAMGFVVYTPE